MGTNILEIFIITANSGSFEKASKQLFISSTALMKQINKLERETGLQLFQRTNRGIILTASGKVFYDSALKIIEEYQHALQYAHDLEYTQKRTLRLGISMINPYKHVVDIFNYNSYFYSSSHITIVPIECNYKAFADQFSNMGKDVDVIPFILGNKELDLICNSYCIANTAFRIAVPKQHRLAQKEILTYSDLENETIVALSGNTNAYYEQVLQAISDNTTNVKFSITNFIDFSTFDFAIKNNHPILISDYLRDVHPSLVFLPVDWDFTIPYGIYYSKAPSSLMTELLNSFSDIGVSGTIEDAKLLNF